MRKPNYPTRWCSQCEIDWPQHTTFNLCPKCGRNTKAETSHVKPDETAARVLAGKYRAFHEWLNRTPEQIPLDAAMQQLEAAYHAAPSIPDPPLHNNPPIANTFPDDAQPGGA